MVGRPESWARTEKYSMRWTHQTPVLDGRLMRFLLLPLLLLSLSAPALAQMKFIVQYEDQFSKWHRFQEKHNEADAVRTAKARAKATGKRFRVVDADGRLIDLIYQ